MSKRLKRKNIVAMLEQAIIEAQQDLHFEEHQHSRAYTNGLLDGYGAALQMLKPKSTVISLTSSWWTEAPKQTSRTLEQLIEFQHVDMSDPEPVGLFETAEAQ
jgi:hypothetical protein